MERCIKTPDSPGNKLYYLKTNITPFANSEGKGSKAGLSAPY